MKAMIMLVTPEKSYTWNTPEHETCSTIEHCFEWPRLMARDPPRASKSIRASVSLKGPPFHTATDVRIRETAEIQYTDARTQHTSIIN